MKGQWGVGSGEWEIRNSVFPHSPFPIPHSPFPIPHFLFAYFPSTSAPKNTYNLPVLESSKFHIVLLRTVR